MKIIAIGHYKRVGKDTFANKLILACYKLKPNYKIIKRSWAWKLKQICHELYAWAGLREPEFYETSEGEALRETILPAIGKSPRQIWIDMGTPAVREQVYDKTWIDYLLNSQHDCDCLIIPDTRFFNEIEAVEAKGGHTIKMIRPNYGPGKNKPDRILLAHRGWHNVIGESGTLDELDRWAEEYAKWLILDYPEPRIDRMLMDELLAREPVEAWIPDDEQESLTLKVDRELAIHLLDQENEANAYGFGEPTGGKLALKIAEKFPDLRERYIHLPWSEWTAA